MGEANRVAQFGPQARINPRPLRPGQQIQIDLKNAVPKVCQNVIVEHTEFGPREHICGSELFTPAVKVFTVSALVSPTGQELTAQQPVLVCLECKKALL